MNYPIPDPYSPENFGWVKIPDLLSEDGRMLYRTTFTMPVFYALSHHGWDFELITEARFEEIYHQAQAARPQPVPAHPDVSFEQRMRETLDILHQVLGPPPGSRR